MTIPAEVVATEDCFSGRVRTLFAAMLKVLVKVETGYRMRDGEALDLAHHKCLSDAMTSIRKRLEINKQFPDAKMRVALAVQEAAILAGVSPAGFDHAQEMILKAREAAFAILKEMSKARQREQQGQAALRERMAKAKTWGREYSRFITGMEKLYNDRLSDLKGLNLPDNVLVRATTELVDIFLAAVAN